ncbi:apolipoprotein L1 isoform 3-T3 [Aulostomus maculatus]
MDRYENLDLDLECDGGGSVAQRASLFGGIIKRSSKSVDASAQEQEKGGMFSGIFKKAPGPAGAAQPEEDSLSASSELSKSNDSLTDSSTKDKGGMFKGMFKKTSKPAKEASAQVSLSPQSRELSGSYDSLADSKPSKQDKSGVFGGMLKRSPKPGHVRRPSQDLLDCELSASNNSLSENTNTKGDLPEPRELSASTDNLTDSDAKAKGGLFSGMFRKQKHKSQSQDDLSVDPQLAASSDSLVEKPSKGGAAAKILKNPFSSSPQEKDKPENSAPSNEDVASTEKPKAKQNAFNAMMKSVFHTDKQKIEKHEGTVTVEACHQEQEVSDSDEETGDPGEWQASSRQRKLAGAMTKLNPFRSANKYEKQAGSDEEDPPAGTQKSSGNKQNAVVGAMTKLNPFRSANKKDAEDSEMLKETEKQVEEKPKMVKSNPISRERKDKRETPPVAPRRAEEEMKGTSLCNKVNSRGSDDFQANKDMTSRQTKEKPAEIPVVPARPSQESQSDGEILREEESAEAREGDETHPPESKTTKKKHKRHNPFMPRAAAKAPSDDEGLKEEEEDKKEEEEEEGKSKPEETKVKKPKRHNPFMPRVKAKIEQRVAQDGAAAENESGNRSLFDQLEEFRIDPAQPETSQDVEDLMEWWNTVEPWEDVPQDDDLTEKEEAKAFALTAEKVQKGIRVFNKLFSERAESLWQHVIDLNAIADGLDKFNKNTKIAQITGGSTSAIGGVATITGLALAPFTMGTSLIVTAVGLGVATAGGLTSAGAGISNQVNNSMDRKKVERIVEDYQEKILDLNKCLKFIKQGIENLRRFDLLKMKKHAYNRDFPALTSSFYEDGAMAGKAILINANEIMRVVQIANVAGSTAARAVQIASMATGVLTGLFVGMDIYFVAKDSKELKKGAKSEFAAKIREVATQLHEGLVELNTIREELQSTATPDDNTGDETAALDGDKKKDEHYDSSEEDEIDRIKKAIKKDIENREYV